MPFVTWEIIRANSERIRCVLVQDVEHIFDSKLLNMVFSDGWIQKVQERQKLKPRRIHREVESAHSAEFKRGRAELQRIIRESRYCGICYMDESAYL